MSRFGLAVLVVLLMVTSAWAVSDYGNTNVTRLWVSTDNGDEAICTGFYVRSPRDASIETGFSWFLSAGHCAAARALMAHRNADVWVLPMVNWQIAVTSGSHGLDIVDFAIGTLPDAKEIRPGDWNRGFWLAEKAPETGRVFIHGFPHAVERVSVAYLMPSTVKLRPDMIKGPSRLLVTKAGEVRPGTSGAPVIAGNGRVIGIVWGVVMEPGKLLAVEMPAEVDFEIVLFTPIEVVLDAFKALDKAKR